MVAVVTHQPGDVSEAVALAESAWTIGDERPSPSPLIHERISG
jgi:hypothetical protein